MINGLDLFSGIGGIAIALKEWVRPIAYCEIDPYCQGELLSRMADGTLPRSPIWDDISSFEGREFFGSVDIVYGGFPCQDISVAGLGKGLEGERSGLFFEIVRLCGEIKPRFIFLENVPAITSRGGTEVVRKITEMGYDSRSCVVSAASVGAPHLRERWFLLAHTQHPRSYGAEIRRGTEASISNASQGAYLPEQSSRMDNSRDVAGSFTSHSFCDRRGADATRYEISPKPEKLQRPDGETCTNNGASVDGNASNSASMRLNKGACERVYPERQAIQHEKSSDLCSEDADPHFSSYWKDTKPPLCGVDDGIPNRVHRIRALGNAVVPSQAKKAFKMLMGIK